MQMARLHLGGIKKYFDGIVGEYKSALRQSDVYYVFVAVVGFSGALVAYDYLFYSLQYFRILDPKRSNYLTIVGDHSFGEIVGYFNMGAAAILLYLASRKTRSAFSSWIAFLPAYMCLDDMFMVHDRVRYVLGDWLFSGFGLARPHDAGELMFYAIVINVVGIAGFLAYRRTAPNLRGFGSMVLPPIAVFIFFAVVFDSFTEFLSDHVGGHVLTRLFEDGGELVSSALICATSYAVYRMALLSPSKAISAAA